MDFNQPLKIRCSFILYPEIAKWLKNNYNLKL